MAAVTIDPPIRTGTGTRVTADDEAHKDGLCHWVRGGRIVCTGRPCSRTHPERTGATPGGGGRRACGYPPCRRCDEITGNYR